MLLQTERGNKMGRYIITASNPKFLTPDEEVVIGAKGLFDLMLAIRKYSKRYATITIKVK